ncbi:MAG: hypothetical protein REI96_12290 [Flavobacterium nitrogenifigens]|uniref:hypothetical protein n=1 Tax=Flavobacterium nitrogenifigens TaxID=1617283 RepID=UPI002806FD55|nr:hypothetical protein [Flavobacterium nitrogenifigens]MDQ8013223.1 hypothetical protein [Flavobacterium nitrogenifigens]
MKMINGGGYGIGPDCKDAWGQPCGSGTTCIGDWQYGWDPNKSQCYQGYCNHIG